MSENKLYYADKIDNDLYIKSSFNTNIKETTVPYFNRHFYKAPERQTPETNFANYLFKNPSECRDTGYLCRVKENTPRPLNRVEFESDKYKSQFKKVNYN